MMTDLLEHAHRRSGTIDVHEVLAEREQSKQSVQEVELIAEGPSGLFQETIATAAGCDTGAPPAKLVH